ncbi:hypothetical protein BGX34_005399 [Mortierella sp. NVP85]|nr:hypothetical protein BGX34_005399 [Mortierella sp. NVP85]
MSSDASLLSAFRVCKAWHAALEPLLWHTLKLQNQPCNFTPRQATPTLLLRNRHHIRHLHETGSNSLMKFLAFSVRLPLMQLTSIHVSILSPEILMIIQQNVETLTSFSCRSNRLRKDLEAQSLWCRQLFFALELVPRLTELAIGPAILLDSPKTVFSKICTHLKKLELDRLKVADRTLYADSIPTEAHELEPFPELEELTLIWNDFPPPCQLELVRKSPKLKSLIWRRGSQLLTQSWLSGTLPVPSDLARLDIGHSHLEDDTMARVLALLPNLVALNARSTPFGARCALQLLENQGPKMIELDLMDCDSLSSTVIQRFLTGMPNLRKFGAARLEASDITTPFMKSNTTASSPSSWVCLDLEELELAIIGVHRIENPAPREACFIIYEQLAQLARLRVLVLRENVSASREEDFRLDWTLRNGLKNLHTLKRLSSLDIQGLHAKVGMEEIEWMAQEWPQLSELKGKLNNKPGVDNKPLERELKRLRPDIVKLE